MLRRSAQDCRRDRSALSDSKDSQTSGHHPTHPHMSPHTRVPIIEKEFCFVNFSYTNPVDFPGTNPELRLTIGGILNPSVGFWLVKIGVCL